MSENQPQPQLSSNEQKRLVVEKLIKKFGGNVPAPESKSVTAPVNPTPTEK